MDLHVPKGRQRRSVMFIGRKSEIEKLNGFYEGEKDSIAVISGQIGVGKTALLQEFAKDKENIFFQAYETTGKHLLEQLSQLIGAKSTLDAAGFCKELCKRAKKSSLLSLINIQI